MNSPGTCLRCSQFENDPTRIESMIPGLSTFGSARASVGADNGICLVHDRIVTARDWCARFSERLPTNRPDPNPA